MRTLRLQLENGQHLVMFLQANHPVRTLNPGEQVEISLPRTSLRLLA
jgi:hypothetical protein